MSDSADAICNVMNHAEAVERREASPLTASKAGKGGTLPFSWGRALSASLAEELHQQGMACKYIVTIPQRREKGDSINPPKREPTP